jgi:hypothetical protein
MFFAFITALCWIIGVLAVLAIGVFAIKRENDTPDYTGKQIATWICIGMLPWSWLLAWYFIR